MNGFGDKLSQKQADMMLKMAASKLGRNTDDVRKAMEKGDVGALTSSLGEEDRKKVDAVLSDPAAMKKILDDPNVKKLLESLGGSR